MITSIELEGFGPYVKPTTIQLGPFTVVTSDVSDRGKSWATVRSLEWCLLNSGPAFNADPAKDEVRSILPDGAKAPSSRVRVTFSSGAWVERFRSASKNTYRIFDGVTEQEYSAVGQGYFDKVGEACGIRPVALDGKNAESVNIRDFYAGPFLLSRSPAQIDTVLSRLMGGDVWEDAGNLIAADLRKSKQDEQTAANQLASVEDSLQALPDIEKGEALLNEAETLLQRCSEAGRMCEVLAAARSQMSFAAYSLAKVKSSIDNLAPVVDNAVLAVEEQQQAQVKLSEARSTLGLLQRTASLLDQIQGIEAETAGNTDALLSVEHIHASVALALQAAAGSRQLQRDLGSRVDAVSATLRAIEVSDRAIVTLTADVEAADKAFHQALRDAGVCPLCEQSTCGKECAA